MLALAPSGLGSRKSDLEEGMATPRRRGARGLADGHTPQDWCGRWRLRRAVHGCVTVAISLTVIPFKLALNLNEHG
jgi:hypothetical protein